MIRTAHLTLATLMTLVPACAGTINFGTDLPLGNLGTSATVGGLTVTAWSANKYNPASYQATTLNNRNQPANDVGLGVCPIGASCPTTNNGDVNEIDNNGGRYDVLRLQVSSGYILNSIGLSSLDGGLKDNFAIYGSNSALPNLANLIALASGSNLSTGSINPVIAISRQYTYYFVTTMDRGICDTDSDFLVRSATTTYTLSPPPGSPVPEPLTSSLVGLGLIGMGWFSRRYVRAHA